MSTEEHLAHLTRPGSDPTNPHQDLYIPPDRLSLSLASDARRTAADSTNASTSNASGSVYNPVPTQLNFGSVEFWTRREQADLERAAPLQAASIHRAAEVARWEWLQIHRSGLEREAREADAMIRNSSAAYAPLPPQWTHRPTPIENGRLMPWRVPSPDPFSATTQSVGDISSGIIINGTDAELESTTLHVPNVAVSPMAPSTAPVSSDVDENSAHLRHPITSTDLQPRHRGRSNVLTSRLAEAAADAASPSSPGQNFSSRSVDERYSALRALQASRHMAAGGTLQEHLRAWNNLCRSLAIAAGVSLDEDEAQGQAGGLDAPPSLSRHQDSLPFGIDAGPRGVPSTTWCSRYRGPAGWWLRNELLRRNNPSRIPTFPAVTPASALATEWRATARNAESTRGASVRARANETATSGATAVPNNSRPPPPEPVEAAIPERATPTPPRVTSITDPLGLPVSLIDPWAVLSPLNEPSRPSLGSASGTSIHTNPPLGSEERSGSPPPDRSSERTEIPASGLQPLPRSEPQIPPDAVSLLQRATAAEEVARLARDSRTRREITRTGRQTRRLAILEPSAPMSNSQVTSSNASTSAHPHRISDTPGMRLLRRLRVLDGLAEDRTEAPSANGGRTSPSADEHRPSQRAPAFHEVFPWHSPPSAVPRGSLPESRAANGLMSRDTPPSTAAYETNLDPDGDGVGQDWYRGVRARIESSVVETTARTGLEDPDGDLIDYVDAPVDGLADRRSPPLDGDRRSRIRRENAETNEDNAARRQRNRTALVISDPVDSTQRDNASLYPNSASNPRPVTEGWRLLNTFPSNVPDPLPDSPVRRTRDEGSNSVTMWLRGPSRTPTLSTSPSPIEATLTYASTERTSAEEDRGDSHSDPSIQRPFAVPSLTVEADSRVIRRPQRLPSLNQEDLTVATSNLSEHGPIDEPDQDTSTAIEPRPIPTWSSPSRRSQFWGSGQPPAPTAPPARNTVESIPSRMNISAFELHRDTPIEQLRSREHDLWRSSLAEQSNAFVVRSDDHQPPLVSDTGQLSSQDGAAATQLRPPRSSLRQQASIPERVAEFSWGSAISTHAHDGIRASADRLGSAPARQRARLDEVRRLRGQIGRTLELSEAILGMFQERPSSGNSTGNQGAHGGQDTPQTERVEQALNVLDDAPVVGSEDPHDDRSLLASDLPQGPRATLTTSSLVRRRTIRDPAPHLRGPRVPRGTLTYLERSAAASAALPSSPLHLSTVSSSLRRSLSSSSLERLSPRDPLVSETTDSAIQATDHALLRQSFDNSLTALLREAGTSESGKSPFPSLVSFEDQVRLGPMPTQFLDLIDFSVQSTALLASFRALVRRMSNWTPPQMSLPSTTMETPHSLRFDISRDLGSSRPSMAGNMRQVLRNDETCLTFDAYQGTEVIVRFLAAVPQAVAGRSATSGAARASGLETSPISENAEASGHEILSRADEDRAWAVARASVIAIRNGARVTGRRVPVEQDGSQNQSSGTLAISAASTTQQISSPAPPVVSDDVRTTPEFARSSIGRSHVPTNHAETSASGQQTPPSDLTDEEFSVLRRVLALRGTAQTVAERVSQLSRLSAEEEDIIRGIESRIYGPGRIAPAALTPATAVASTTALDQQAEPNPHAPISEFSSTVTSHLVDGPLPHVERLSTPTPVPLTEEQFSLIQQLCAHALLKCQEGLTPTSAGIFSLVDKESLDRFVKSRTESLSKQLPKIDSSDLSDPLGPVFALSSLVIKVRETPSQRQTRATEDIQECGLSSMGMPSKDPKDIIHALVFFSVDPITREQLAQWDNVSKTDALRYLRMEKRERLSRMRDNDGAPLNGRLEPWEYDGDLDAEEEERDLGDPTAVARRREQQRKADEDGLQRLLLEKGTTDPSMTGSKDFPLLRPAAIVPLDLSRGGAMVNLEQEGSRNHGDARQRKHRPVGRYMAVKLLALDGQGSSVGQTGTSTSGGHLLCETSVGGGSDDVGAKHSVDLCYIGVKGWPAAGTGSLDGRWFP